LGRVVETKTPTHRQTIDAFIKQPPGPRRPPAAPGGKPESDTKEFEALPGNKYLLFQTVLFDLSDLQSFRVFFQHKEFKDAPPAGEGPITPALKAAAEGKPAVLGVAFANLPDEIRQENNIPAEVRPFQPLFFTDAGILIADIVNGELVLDARFKAATKGKANEAEKSIGALKTLVQTALGLGISQLEKEKDQLAMVEFVKDLQATVKGMKIANEDNTASATLTAKADLNYAPFLEFVFGRVGGASDRMMDANNLKQIGLALHNYHDVNAGFPPAAVVGKKGKPLLSWRVAILPYIDEAELYKKFHLDEPWDSEHNTKVLADNPMPKVFLAPGGTAKAGDKKTHYQVFTGNGAMFDVIEGSKIQSITDGTSNTLMVATAKTPVEWTKPADLEFDPKGDPRDLLLFVNDVCNVAFADGSVRAMAKKTPVETFRAIITKAGGEVVDIP
jgi:prepilin-type processing-associated H-X9-DG protein